MDIQNVKEEIDIHNIKEEVVDHDDILSNINLKQELFEEVSTLKIQNTNDQINGSYAIKQELKEDLNTNNIFDNYENVAYKTKRNIFSTHHIKNKLGDSRVNYGKRIKLKARKILE
ncbi:uncharacterized protein LOC130447687 isoform X2 [Diorhabda sublineata]|uniref:uncharacterized protein LOC130447687 isoform X2 n=1 Tax=Diorhabda sublineata TaxID=1163346 RepID=UPI0024E0AC3A|nr:uncharacterized protein LOC130447687 isoform X2 [Diorhabda sublineata]